MSGTDWLGIICVCLMGTLVLMTVSLGRMARLVKAGTLREAVVAERKPRAVPESTGDEFDVLRRP